MSMLIATDSAVYVWYRPATGDDGPPVIARNVQARAIVEHGNLKVIATDHCGWLYCDDHRICFEVGHTIACVLIPSERRRRLLIGTQEAHLYELSEQSPKAHRIDSFDQLPCRTEWHTPWGGPPAVRSLAASSDGQTVYADIHVGSIMRSEDAGQTWEPVNPTLNEDVHQVVTCPAAPARVYANTANAVYISEDCGRSWNHRKEGLNARYGRAIAVHPDDPDCLLASVSDGPHRGNGQLYRTDDTGVHWTHITVGFPPSTQNNIDTFHIGFAADSSAWAVVEHTLYTSIDRGRSWTVGWEAPERIKQIACEQ